MGAYVILNQEWAVTAAHVLAPAHEANAQLPRAAEWNALVADVEASDRTPGQKKGERKRLDREFKAQELVQTMSVWLGHNDIRMGLIKLGTQSKNIRAGWPVGFSTRRNQARRRALASSSSTRRSAAQPYPRTTRPSCTGRDVPCVGGASSRGSFELPLRRLRVPGRTHC